MKRNECSNRWITQLLWLVFLPPHFVYVPTPRGLLILGFIEGGGLSKRGQEGSSGVGGGQGVLWILSDGDDRMRVKIKTHKNP